MSRALLASVHHNLFESSMQWVSILHPLHTGGLKLREFKYFPKSPSFLGGRSWDSNPGLAGLAGSYS